MSAAGPAPARSPEGDPWRLLGLVALGLLLGALCLGVGALALGMGHGWDLPARFGVLSLGLYPLALVRLGRPERGAEEDRVAFALALVAVPVLWVYAVAATVPAPPVGNVAQALILLVPVLAYAAALVAWRRSRWGDALADGALLALGLLLDWAAWADFTDPSNLWGKELSALWVAPWLGWQAVAGLALWRDLHETNRRAA